MTNEILIVDRVDLRRIDTDIGKQKRAARRIPRPLWPIKLIKSDMDKISNLELKLELGDLYNEGIHKFQVVLLPEKISLENGKSYYVDTEESIAIYKDLLKESIEVANSEDLDVDSSIYERRSGDIWLGEILIIDNIAIPFVINIVTNYLSRIIGKKEGGTSLNTEAREDKHAASIHLKVKLYKNGQINKIDFQGDSETLGEVMKSILRLNKMKN